MQRTALQRRIMADDGSCLFRAIKYVLKMEESIEEMRALVATMIVSSTEEFNEAILGEKPEKYAQKIMQKNTWGGEIELLCLSRFAQTTLCAVDIENGMILRYSEGIFALKSFVIFSGIHYDALADGDMTQFPANDEMVDQRALVTAAELKKQGHYTNLQTFTLRCSTCKTGMKGTNEAQQHAKSTKHTSFEEYR